MKLKCQTVARFWLGGCTKLLSSKLSMEYWAQMSGGGFVAREKSLLMYSSWFSTARGQCSDEIVLARAGSASCIAQTRTFTESADRTTTCEGTIRNYVTPNVTTARLNTQKQQGQDESGGFPRVKNEFSAVASYCAGRVSKHRILAANFLTKTIMTLKGRL